MKVDWALDGPIPWTAPRTCAAPAPCTSAASEDEFLDALARAGATAWPSARSCCSASSRSPTRRARPTGKHTAWAYTHGPQDGVDWAREPTRHVERIEAQVERFAPGFRDRILARHVLGPADLEARNANLVGGDVGGGTLPRSTRSSSARSRRSRPYRTPLRGLFLGSAATFPGGAVHGVPGRAAARAALIEARIRRR